MDIILAIIGLTVASIIMRWAWKKFPAPSCGCRGWPHMRECAWKTMLERMSNESDEEIVRIAALELKLVGEYCKAKPFPIYMSEFIIEARAEKNRRGL